MIERVIDKKKENLKQNKWKKESEYIKKTQKEQMACRAKIENNENSENNRQIKEENGKHI